MFGVLSQTQQCIESLDDGYASVRNANMSLCYMNMKNTSNNEYGESHA